MSDIEVIDRESKEKFIEKVYGRKALEWLYGRSLLGRIFMFLASYISLFSKFYGWLQRSGFSKKKIQPFIEQFSIKMSDFEDKKFDSFNDFFIRKLKNGARPLSNAPAILFADARYRFFPDLSKVDHFFIKGQKFDLTEFLQNEKLATKYKEGAMVIARLCPTDYHRFHFPFDCIPSKPRKIQGPLFSVNPLALKRRAKILTQNKRHITQFSSKVFGRVQFVEIGATYVGSIHQTHSSNLYAKKGEEKGYFSFGGSCIVLLFEKGKITFDADLTREDDLEIYGKLGQSMGIAF